jgi:hypothetical protein
MNPTPTAPRWIAAALLLWLAALVIGTGFAAIVLLNSGDDYLESTSYQVVLCVTGGAFGASVAALLRAVERIAHGWSDAAAPAHGFSTRRAPLLAVQPVLGAALGLLLYLLLSALVVVLLRVSDGTVFDPQGLLLVAAATGLIARALLARLRDMVDALFGRPAAAPSTIVLRDAMPPERTAGEAGERDGSGVAR